MKNVMAAVAAVQAEIPALPKSADNPFFKSKYVPLDKIVEVVSPLLEKHGLMWTALPSYGPDNSPALVYSFTHLESGEELSGTMPLMLQKNDPQGQGSAITYARRYALSAVLNLIADADDDGHAASKRAVGVRSDGSPVVARPQDFASQVRATGVKANDLQIYFAAGDDNEAKNLKGAALTAYLNDMNPVAQAALLKWAKGES